MPSQVGRTGTSRSGRKAASSAGRSLQRRPGTTSSPMSRPRPPAGSASRSETRAPATVQARARWSRNVLVPRPPRVPTRATMRARGGCWALSRAATRRSRPSGAASDSTSKVTRRCPAGASGSTAAGPRSRTASALGVSAAMASSGSSEGEHRNGSAPVQARTSARTSSSRGPEESAAAIGPSDRGSVRPAPTGPAKPAAMMRTLTPGAGGAPSAVRLAQAAGGGSGPEARALIGGAAEAPRTAEGAGEAGTATPSVRAGYGGVVPASSG